MPITKKTVKDVVLTGATPILFDRYPGDNRTQLSPDQKMYLFGPKNILTLPASNLLSFFTATNTESAPKLLMDKRTYKETCSALAAVLSFEPEDIPFLRDGKPIVFGGFTEEDGEYDPISGVRVVHHVARLKDGVPNVKHRPMLYLPWELRFKMIILPHKDLTVDQIQNFFIDGGAMLGLCTYRKRYGKFEMTWS
jgi:hypothetical protein